MKKINKKPDIPRIISLMGQEKFSREVQNEILNGTPRNELSEAVVRRKLAGII